MIEFTLPSQYDDVLISVAMIEPEGKPKGILQLVHGMVEHKVRYYEFMEWMASQGYVCVIHDHRGHGKSVKGGMKDLGFMYSGGWKAMVEDTRMVCDYIKGLYPDLPATLLGHSMGSMVVRSFTKRYDYMIDALIVCGCPSENPLGAVGKFLAKTFAVICGERFRPNLLTSMSIGTFRKAFKGEKSKNSWITTDAGTVAVIDSDPLSNFAFTANGYFNLTSLMMDCYDVKGWALKKADLPVRFISGANDPCRISDSALLKAVESMRKAGYSNVTLSLYPGMRHHVLLEHDRQKVWDEIKEMTDRYANADTGAQE